MIFPIGDENIKGSNKPYISYTLIAVNIIIFLFQISLDTRISNQLIFTYGAIPSHVLAGEDFSSLITNMFLHGGWLHLIGNMLYLWIFGDNIEAIIGTSKFIIFYICGGVFASASHILMNSSSEIPSIGASGAIAAVMGSYLVMFPKSKIKIFFFFKIIYISALIFFGLWIVQNLYSGFQDMNADSSHKSETAWWAHIGGFAFGVISGLYFKKKAFLNNNSESIT